MMTEERMALTLPAACRRLGISRAVGERLVYQYPNRIPPHSRVGITRTWGPELLDVLREILAEESRIHGGVRE